MSFSIPGLPRAEAAALTAVTVFALFAARTWARRTTRRKPPGPKAKPLVGNFFDIPAAGQEGPTYLRWGKEHDSQLISMELLWVTMVVVNTYDAAVELFDRRGSNYSGRHTLYPSYHGASRTNVDDHVPSVPRDMGRPIEGDCLFHQTFGTAAVKKFPPPANSSVYHMMHSLLEEPGQYCEILRHMSSALAVSLTYGTEVLPKHDPLIAKLDQMIENNISAFVPGTFLVKDLPFLRHAPSWVPFQRKLAQWRRESDVIVLEPFLQAKADFENGVPTDSFVSVNLREADELKESGARADREKIIMDTAATMYSAAADTTLNTILYFVLAMTWHPEIQAKAQIEIDRVLQGRLPTFEDHDSLPIVSALLKEVMRFFTLLPLSIPHTTEKDDEYEGFHIPAGSIVQGNTWAILHDPIAYPEPFEFKPERFMQDGQLNPDARDPNMAFGFGRRICPGRYLAKEFVWLTMVSLLSSFDITRSLDKDGNPIRPSGKYALGLLAIPDAFPCDIKPRSAHAVASIRQSSAHLL